jgi:type IV pilus assembly protein PilP
MLARRASLIACCVHHPNYLRATLLACVISIGCDETVEQTGRGMSNGPAVAAKSAQAQPKVMEGLSFKDDDFVESDHNRDPFRSYASSFGPHKLEASAESQRSVIMPTTAVESMKLIAIISGLARPKAMLTDVQGVGYVVQRGDYIGTPKVFQTTGSVAMTLNWRVDRIRDTEVVLTRQDPSDPSRMPLSRIISMRDELAAR